jgi:AAA+ ATPase superfamily predicted ATPase
METNKLFGRSSEKAILDEHLASNESSLIAIIGRRRVGKTYLVRRTLEDKIDFEMVGSQNGTQQEQLLNFQIALMKYLKSKIQLSIPTNWTEAFYQLQQYLQLKKGNKKKVVFFDEFPWINTAKSGFIEKFAHFWNSWASENNVLIVLCGSAATWMLKNVVNGKGGLHNRISQTIHLHPFQLPQTKEMLQGMGIKTTNAQLAELYMVFGGVPYYLSLLKKSKSIYQNIDALLFEANGKLINEYQNLLPSLFDDATNHLAVLNAMATKWKGLNRSELTSIYKKSDGGGLTKILIDLEQSGFITSYAPYKKLKKDTLYRISDPYVLFYLKFLKKNRQTSFADITKSANYKVWCGYAYENLCMQHINIIQNILGLSKIQTFTSSYFYKGNKHESGFQIDLLIERADNVVNICEVKYHNKAYLITKKDYEHIKYYISKFQEVAGKKVAIHYTMITANGIVKNEYSNEILDTEITLSEIIEDK